MIDIDDVERAKNCTIFYLAAVNGLEAEFLGHPERLVQMKTLVADFGRLESALIAIYEGGTPKEIAAAVLSTDITRWLEPGGGEQ